LICTIEGSRRCVKQATLISAIASPGRCGATGVANGAKSVAGAAETLVAAARWQGMSDAYDYFLAHAVAAVQKARGLPEGPLKRKQRTVARVYHLLAKEAAYGPNTHHLEDFRAARRIDARIARRSR
jgi:hypothetical protein